MLLGRSALARRYLVDVTKRYALDAGKDLASGRGKQP
jgi:hypothetical protein